MSKLWGGRFGKKEVDPYIMEFTSSLGVDHVLASYDCLSTKVHVDMLCRSGYLTKKEKEKLHEVLDGLYESIREGSWEYPASHEDIHSAIQSYVEEKAPEESKKMHTGRSRNEQVVNDVRLYCLDKIGLITDLITELQIALVELAEKNMDVIVPGYTHLNRAQPVLFPHLLLAYVDMLQRDVDRVLDAESRCDISVMGSGALAGSALDLDREFVARELEFGVISTNSIDSVSDRDFMAELVSCLSLIAVHLSRMSEDMILYSIPEFGFLDMGSEFCTGSSLMPQKKNPDVLELIRGRAAGVIGALNSIFVLLKGLPHSYNRDLQEDKKPLFESVDTVSSALAVMARLVGTVKMDKEKALKALEDEFIYATDIAEYLVRKGIAFREAHDIVGSIVKHCSDKGINISGLSISELKGFSPGLDEDVFTLLNPETSVRNKRTPGSTNPDMVKGEIDAWKKRLQ